MALRQLCAGGAKLPVYEVDAAAVEHEFLSILNEVRVCILTESCPVASGDSPFAWQQPGPGSSQNSFTLRTMQRTVVCVCALV